MRTFLCLGCGEVYSEGIANEDNLIGYSTCSPMYACPKINCNCGVVEVDDFLISVVRNLNELGFNTLACCSGHAQDSNAQLGRTADTYIMLESCIYGEEIPEWIFKELVKTLPFGFNLECDFYDDIGRFTLRRSVKCDDESEVMLAIADNCASLLDWTNNELPDFLEHYFPDGEFSNSLYDNSDFEGELDSEDCDEICQSLGRSVTPECEDCHCDGKGSICKCDCEPFKLGECEGCYMFNDIVFNEVKL